jgi:hypothetical protein
LHSVVEQIVSWLRTKELANDVRIQVKYLLYG